jgi:adenine-specific DNA methylase
MDTLFKPITAAPPAVPEQERLEQAEGEAEEKIYESPQPKEEKEKAVRVEKPAEAIPTKVECYFCTGVIEVKTQERPTKVTCPHCGEEGLIE